MPAGSEIPKPPPAESEGLKIETHEAPKVPKTEKELDESGSAWEAYIENSSEKAKGAAGKSFAEAPARLGVGPEAAAKAATAAGVPEGQKAAEEALNTAAREAEKEINAEARPEIKEVDKETSEQVSKELEIFVAEHLPSSQNSLKKLHLELSPFDVFLHLRSANLKAFEGNYGLKNICLNESLSKGKRVERYRFLETDLNMLEKLSDPKSFPQNLEERIQFWQNAKENYHNRNTAIIERYLALAKNETSEISDTDSAEFVDKVSKLTKEHKQKLVETLTILVESHKQAEEQAAEIGEDKLHSLNAGNMEEGRRTIQQELETYKQEYQAFKDGMALAKQSLFSK